MNEKKKEFTFLTKEDLDDKEKIFKKTIKRIKDSHGFSDKKRKLSLSNDSEIKFIKPLDEYNILEIILNKLLSENEKIIISDLCLEFLDLLEINDIPYMIYNSTNNKFSNIEEYDKKIIEFKKKYFDFIPENIMEKINKMKDKYNYYLDTCEELISKNCLRRNYVAMIVKDDEMLIAGRNEAPEGFESCVSKNKCYRKEHNIEHGTCYELCNSVHAEQNCIIKLSVPEMMDCTLYLVGKEYDTDEYIKDIDCCLMCKKMIINSGISKVVMRINKEEYKIVNVKEDWKDILK